jgi:hypothetical protein
LNLSVLDGWWAEAYAPEVGWALGDGREHGDDPAWDATEAEALYTLLEREVVPEFYDRDAQGIPRGWVARVRESMSRLTPRFSANRVVREYTENHYLPAARAYAERAAEKGAVGASVRVWQQHLAQHWSEARFGAVAVETRGDLHHFAVALALGGLDPEAVRVEIYADPLDDETSASRCCTSAGAGPATRPIRRAAPASRRRRLHGAARHASRRPRPLRRPGSSGGAEAGGPRKRVSEARRDASARGGPAGADGLGSPKSEDLQHVQTVHAIQPPIIVPNATFSRCSSSSPRCGLLSTTTTRAATGPADISSRVTIFSAR